MRLFDSARVVLLYIPAFVLWYIPAFVLWCVLKVAFRLHKRFISFILEANSIFKKSLH
jgi:hypothetical protein